MPEALQVERLAALVGTDPAVRAVTPVAAGDKADALSDRRRHAGGGGADRGRRRRRGRAALGPVPRGAELAQPFAVGELSSQFLRLEGPEVAALAADPGVVAITAWSRPAAAGTSGRPRSLPGTSPRRRADGPGYLDWLDDEDFGGSTFDFAIDVTDSGPG